MTRSSENVIVRSKRAFVAIELVQWWRKKREFVNFPHLSEYILKRKWINIKISVTVLFLLTLSKAREKKSYSLFCECKLMKVKRCTEFSFSMFPKHNPRRKCWQVFLSCNYNTLFLWMVVWLCSALYYKLICMWTLLFYRINNINRSRSKSEVLWVPLQPTHKMLFIFDVQMKYIEQIVFLRFL